MKPGDMAFLLASSASENSCICVVTRYCLRLRLITKVEHILSASCTQPQQHVRSLTKQLLLCSPISGPSVYQSVSCITLQPGGNLEHPPAGHSEWTHPRIQGDAQQNTHKTCMEYKFRKLSMWKKTRQPCLNILTSCPGAILFSDNLQVLCGKKTKGKLS